MRHICQKSLLHIQKDVITSLLGLEDRLVFSWFYLVHLSIYITLISRIPIAVCFYHLKLWNESNRNPFETHYF